MLNTTRQTLLYAAGALCVIVAAVQWGLMPAREYQASLAQQEKRLTQRLELVHKLSARLQHLQTQSRGKGDTAGRDTDFNLFSFLENRASADQVKDSIEYMRPISEQLPAGGTLDKVQMRLAPVRLAQLTRFLAAVERAPQDITTERLAIRSPRQNPGLLRVDALFSTRH